jgi:flagellar motor switch/type III secretory pathway protein FliN
MPQFSTKRLAIDKAYATILIAISITTFIVMFSLVASKALYSQMRYQSKVSSKKETALDTLKSNLQTSDQLITAYEAFANETTNALGGNPKGDGPNDGDNPRLVLDALPSKYDFPALTTSIEKLLNDKGFSLTSITGNDDEVAQASQNSSADPQPIEIPFSVEVTTSDGRVKQLMQLFEKSIRPIQVHQLALQSQNGQLKATITAKTFYQPEKNLNVKSEAVK